MERIQTEDMDIDIKAICYMLLRKAGFIVFIAIVCAGITWAVTKKYVKMEYSSSSTMYVFTQASSSISSNDFDVSAQVAKAYLVLATSRTVVETVIRDLQLEMTYEEFVPKVAVDSTLNTCIIKVSITDEDPVLAKTMVDHLVLVLCDKVTDIMAVDAPNIVDKGTIPTEPVSPNIKKYVLVSGVFGAFFTCVVLIFMFIMNDVMTSEEEVERYFGVKVLASIPFKEGTSIRKHITEQKKLNRRAYKEYRKKKKKKRQAQPVHSKELIVGAGGVVVATKERQEEAILWDIVEGYNTMGEEATR